MWLRAFFIFGSMKVVGLIAFLSAMSLEWPSHIENSAMAVWLVGLVGLLGLGIGQLAMDIINKLKAN